MAIFSAPSTAAVRAEVNLLEEQVSPAFSSSDYNTAIDTRIADAVAYVEERLSGKFGAANLASLSANQLSMGATAERYWAAAGIYHIAGSLDEKYKEEAADYERRANLLLSTLEGSLASTIGPQPGTAAYAVVPARVDGYTRTCGEYACEDSCA